MIASQNKMKLQKNLELSLLALVVFLQLVWGLPQTIALRNFCLYGGCVISLLLIIFFYGKFQLKNHMPMILLLAVPAWLVFHYIFLPVNLEKQWYDLSGTWLRIFSGIVIAFSLGKLLVNSPHYFKWVYISYVFLIMGSIILFFKQSYVAHQWIFDFSGIFKTKIACAYYSFFLCLLTYGILLKNQSSKIKTALVSQIFFFTVFILCIFSCFVIHSLIGVIFCILMGVVCSFMMLNNFGTNHRLRNILALALPVVLIVSAYAFSQYDKKYEGKLMHLKNDIVISLDIDQNKTWSRSTSVVGIPDPVDQNGRPISGSTYERISWLIKGLQTLSDHPLGSGFSWAAFRHYMAIEYPGSTVDKTHSGWLDLALGIGLPGLFLTWSAIFLVLKQAFAQLKAPHHGNQSFIIIFFLMGMCLFWLVGEVSEREFIEHFFFFIALSSSYLCHLRLKNDALIFHNK
jgi:hypothetical protein